MEREEAAVTCNGRMGYGISVWSKTRKTTSAEDNLYTSPFAIVRSGWPGCAMDKNSWLRSMKLLHRWSI